MSRPDPSYVAVSPRVASPKPNMPRGTLIGDGDGDGSVRYLTDAASARA
jgi:hypothetical protein